MASSPAIGDAPWPPLPSAGWTGTYATLHLWTQVVGKVALATAPPLNHCWGSALQLTPRGLITRTLRHGHRTFTLEFDFHAHVLRIVLSDGEGRVLPLVPCTVADFYRGVLQALGELGIDFRIWPVAVELPEPIRLDRDVDHASYDRDWVERWWRITSQVGRVFTDARCRFVGKASPTHLFWGAFDLASTRFSGRPAPPREGPAFMRDAYSHEVISHGFWPGSGPVREAAFYAYAVPEPAGLKEARVHPDAAYYHPELGEFILPYEAVRTAGSPEDAIRAFVESTYEAAARLGGWDSGLIR